MKLVILCLLAVSCWASVQPAAAASTRGPTIIKRKLHEVLRQLNDVKHLQHNETMLSAPPENIEDCCCLSALHCFRANLQVHFNVAEKKLNKLSRSLKHQFTEKGLEFCDSDRAVACHDCHSQPLVNVPEFFNRLESLIQRALARLSVD